MMSGVDEQVVAAVFLRVSQKAQVRVAPRQRVSQVKALSRLVSHVHSCLIDCQMPHATATLDPCSQSQLRGVQAVAGDVFASFHNHRSG